MPQALVVSRLSSTGRTLCLDEFRTLCAPMCAAAGTKRAVARTRDMRSSTRRAASVKREPIPLRVVLFVNGTLMRGEPLHRALGKATYLGIVRTAPKYRLFTVADIHPAMIAVGDTGGYSVAGELYELSLEQLRTLLRGEPAGLGLGVVQLETEELCLGICWLSSRRPRQARDISDFGGWREYKRSRQRRSLSPR